MPSLSYAGRFALLSLDMGSPSGEGFVASILAWDVSPTENVSLLTVMGVCGLTSYPTLVWLKFVMVSSSGEKVAN